jgi:hypothetical protein
VLSFGENCREYLVKLDRNAKVYRRNRKFLRPQKCDVSVPPKQPVQAPNGPQGILKSDPRSVEKSQKKCSFVEPQGRGGVGGKAQVHEPNARPKRDAPKPKRFDDYEM